MSKSSEAAGKYADELWNSSEPKDWAWEDSVRDFEAGWKAAIEEAIRIIQEDCDGDLDFAVFKLRALSGGEK
jgi:hypothetical protein